MNNLALLTDFYELTMAYSYFKEGKGDVIAYFDVFFRRNPDKGGFAVFSGLEQIIDYIINIKFTKEDIDFLRNKNMFDEDFLEYLENFKFKGDVYAFKEGSVIFPHEPVITVRANIIEAQIIETMTLLQFNHQSLIATKANRIVTSANGRAVMEFGARRAHGVSASINGARAAYIAGCVGTSNTILGKMYDISVLGTMAHSYVQSFDSELEAFKAYCRTFPDNATLLVDSYDTLKSGVPNAIKAFKEIVLPLGHRPKGIRIDSGDLSYLAKEARRMLDEAGFEDVKIIASNSLDEYLIKELLNEQGAPIDIFGVGERLICARSEPVFGGVYKLVATQKGDKMTPKIKISDNIAKMTNPGFKRVYRIYNEKNEAQADLVCLHDEVLEDGQTIEIFDPNHTWKRKTLENIRVKDMRDLVIKDGVQIVATPSLEEMRNHLKSELKTMDDSIKRFSNPHEYYVDLSQKLWDLRERLIKENK
ncbi:TPA: nicotinate phosphoribosyltransferase [bacterium]|nr:nicotinate phosphoribosyltransferase [bacterium]